MEFKSLNMSQLTAVSRSLLSYVSKFLETYDAKWQKNRKEAKKSNVKVGGFGCGDLVNLLRGLSRVQEQKIQKEWRRTVERILHNIAERNFSPFDYKIPPAFLPKKSSEDGDKNSRIDNVQTAAGKAPDETVSGPFG